MRRAFVDEERRPTVEFRSIRMCSIEMGSSLGGDCSNRCVVVDLVGSFLVVSHDASARRRRSLSLSGDLHRSGESRCSHASGDVCPSSETVRRHSRTRCSRPSSRIVDDLQTSRLRTGHCDDRIHHLCSDHSRVLSTGLDRHSHRFLHADQLLVSRVEHRHSPIHRRIEKEDEDQSELRRRTSRFTRLVADEDADAAHIQTTRTVAMGEISRLTTWKYVSRSSLGHSDLLQIVSDR